MLNETLENIQAKGLVNEEVLTEHLRKLREQTYAFQSKQQVDSIVLERFDFNMGTSPFSRRIADKTKFPVQSSYLFNIEYGFISPQRKLRLKRSGFLGKEITQYQISEMSDVFDKNFLMFVDGKFVDCVKIIVFDGNVTLTVPTYSKSSGMGIQEEEIKRWINEGAHASVLFFTNTQFNPYITNREILKNNRKFLSLKDTGIVDELEDDERYVTFVTSNNLGFASNLVYTPNRESLLSLFKQIDKNMGRQRAFINIFGFRNLSRAIELEGDENFFQLPGYVMPVPVENVVVLRETAEGLKLAYDIELKRHYPNFYEVVGNDDMYRLKILVFFSEQNQGVIGYTNELESYYKILGNSIDVFLDATTSVRNYVPRDFDFSIKDYEQSGFSSPLEYKIHLLSELIDNDPNHLKNFIRDHIQTFDGLIVDMSKINLDSRLRSNNYTEISERFNREVFDEDRYMFAFKDLTDGGRYAVVYYIDGDRYTPDKTYTRGKYEYIYIHPDLITPTSIIEIERILIYDNIHATVFTDADEPKQFTLTETTTRNDIFITLESNEIVDPADYEVHTIVDSERVYYPVGDRTPIASDTIYIEMKNKNLLNIETVVHIDRFYEAETFVVNEPTNIYTIEVPLEANVNVNNVRVYVNNRLINPDAYVADHSGVYTDALTITLGMPFEEGDRITYEYIPDSFTKVFELKELPAGNLIYLQGIIDRPFSLDYYDLYVNGRKLNKLNVDILSPYLIQIHGVRSVLNFEIYERARATDPVSPDPNAKTIIDELWETDEKFKNGLLGVNTGTTNTEPDIVGELVDIGILLLNSFWYRYMMMEFVHINPDVDIDQKIVNRFKRLFERITILHLNGEIVGTDETYVDTFHINPDNNR